MTHTHTQTGYGDIHPWTASETVLVMVMMLVAVSLCTAIIASFASVFAHGNIALWEHEQRMDVIRQYMTWKHLPPDIQQTVNDYFHYLWVTNAGTEEESILFHVPWHLRKEIMIVMQGAGSEHGTLLRRNVSTLRGDPHGSSAGASGRDGRGRERCFVAGQPQEPADKRTGMGAVVNDA